jgi:plastocyanin
MVKATYANVGSLPASASNTGKVMYVQADGYMYYSTGATWVKVAKFNDTTSLTYNINALTDVDTSTVAPLINQVLGWNGTNWVPVNQASATPQLTLTDLTDVDTSTPPEIAEVLAYDGNNWVPATLSLSFSGLEDSQEAGLTVDQFWLPAITQLFVTADGMSGYVFGAQYNDATNPTIWALSGTTISFLLNTPGHPFLIQTAAGVNYDTGLIHVSPTGVVSDGSNAQGKTSGTLYWTVPIDVSGNYKYQCSIHAGMNGTITVKDLRAI